MQLVSFISNMTTLSIAIITLAVVTHGLYAQELAPAVSTVKPPVNMTYEELMYIMETRQGITTRKRPKQMTPCARAILGCCDDKVMNTHCSEILKCGVHFFDDNPCDDKFLIDALQAAKTFYSQLTGVTER